LNRPFNYAPPQTNLTYIYQDESLIIVDKPAGLLSVPGKSEPDCLEARIREDFPNALTIHRLDMATSGVMVFAQTPQAQRHVGLQFEKRMIEKVYIASVSGKVLNDEGEIHLPLIADWPNRPKQKICHETGKPSQTYWSVIARENTETRMRLMPKTGRSHQLRVHMLAIGHPILGDRLYAPDEAFSAAPRLLLHANTIKLRNPIGGDWVEFTSPCPF